MKPCAVTFEELISLENLCAAWEEFIRGKRGKKDVQEFAFLLSDEIMLLHEDLVSGTYRHGLYHEFRINDPKPRVIHKASVRDRLLHHAVHRKLYPYFARSFITDSFSCQKGKGVHRAVGRFQTQTRKTSRNHSQTCWVLKCDIRKFFASVDHYILADLLEQRIGDVSWLRLLYEIIGSFSVSSGKGIPLGNLTSQLFANIYMDSLDQFVKYVLRHRWYMRYADDFVFLSEERGELERLLPIIESFLKQTLRLDLHPAKIDLRTIASGVDFLGWVHFPQHRTLRTKTKTRMMKRVMENPAESTFQSYFGMLKHGNAFDLYQELENVRWLTG